MDDERVKPPDGPEPLPPAEHEEAVRLEEAQQKAREAGLNGTPDADLPKVHGDEA